MKANPISFADVLKRKEKGYQSAASNQTMSLEAMLAQWEQSPEEDYTLYLGPSSFGRNRSSQQMIKSNNMNKGGMFDSWIERQALDNKQNTEQMGNRYSKDYKIQYGPKKIVLNSKGGNIKTFGDRKKIKNMIKNQWIPSEEVQLINSKEYSQETSHTIANNIKKEELSLEIEDHPKYIVAQKTISQSPNPSKKTTMQMRDLKNLKKEQTKYTEVPENCTGTQKGKIKVAELQQLVNQTDHIHEEIAQLAHRFVLEEKKKSQNEEEELLLSLQGAKKFSAIDQKCQKDGKLKDNMIEEQEENKNKLRQQVKKQIGNFFKNSQLKNHLPSFGAKNIQDNYPKSIQKHDNNQMIPIKTSQQCEVAEVGYSFATHIPPISLPVQKGQEYIPMLDIMQIPTIPLIQEIASERHNSQSNEEIENMYSKWRRQENQHIDSKYVKAIESVNFFKVEAEKHQVHSHQKQNRSAYQEYYDFKLKKSENEQESPKQQPQPVKKRSAEKPEIIINIPIDYYEQQQANKRSVKEYESSSVADKNIINKSGVLCLSQSSKKSIKLSIDRKDKGCEEDQIQLFTHQHNQNINDSGHSKPQKKPQSLKSPSVHPSRDIYLSNQEEDPQEKNYQQEKVELNTEFKVDDHELENKATNHNSAMTQPEPAKVNENATAPKQSSSIHFKSYGLNKVYSNVKQQQGNINKEVPGVKTSEFETVQLLPRKEEAASDHLKRPDSNHFSFGHHNNLINNLKAEMKDSKDANSKKKNSATKITLVASNKSKEKMNPKIESYAHTSAFIPGNIKPVLQEASSQPLNNQEESEEFNFDF